LEATLPETFVVTGPEDCRFAKDIVSSFRVALESVVLIRFTSDVLTTAAKPFFCVVGWPTLGCFVGLAGPED
jgi:hypothetical protein